MKLTETKLEGVYIIAPQVFGDERGWFMESYSKIKTPELNCEFVQDNHSFSKEKRYIARHQFSKWRACARKAG